MIVRLCLLFVGYILFVAFTNVATVAFSWIYALIFATGFDPGPMLLLIPVIWWGHRWPSS